MSMFRPVIAFFISLKSVGLNLTHWSLFYDRFGQPFYHIKVLVMNKPATYRINVRGNVPENWIDRLVGLRIVTASSTQTTLEGLLPDQAALKGVLDSLYGLHLPLLELRVNPALRGSAG